MRFYNIEISDPTSGALIKQYTSLDSSGATMLGALNIELDVPAFQFATPMGNDTIRIWGISLTDIKAASTYNNKILKLYAGMAKGLPLANPKQQGLLLEGVINQCFGNWQGVDMTLDFVVVYGIGGTSIAPKNLVLNWTKGQTLGAAIKAALAVAAPTIACNDFSSPNLVQDKDEPAFYENLAQLSEYAYRKSLSLMKGTYPGLSLALKNGAFFIYDNTTQSAPKAISFTDLIGQPTWLAPNEIQFKTAMRGDIGVNDYITLPPSQITTQAQSFSQYRNGSILQGTFMVDQVRHVGNFRQPDGGSWVTIFNAHPSPAP